MSRYDYGPEDELDDSLMFSRADRARQAGKKMEAERILRGMMTARAPRALGEPMEGTRTHLWEMSLQGSPTVLKGKIAVPADQVGDMAMMKVFEKLFEDVQINYCGSTRFSAHLKGLALGRFDVGPSGAVKMDMLTGSLDHLREPYQDLHNRAIRWLRQNLTLRLTSTDEYHAPYTSRRITPEDWRFAREKEKLRGLAQMEMHLDPKVWESLPKPVRKDWVPVNEGAKNLASDGVNLSKTGGTGMVNMAFSTLMENTSNAGERVERIGAAGQLLRMDKAGEIIG